MIGFLAEIATLSAGLATSGARAMDDKKSTRFSLDELARQLAESVPQNLKVLGQDLERNFKTLLQSGIERMELVSREEFDVQRAVLERTRAKLEAMEGRLAELEKALSARS
jgi:BMFP domain-containing protein YqiC